MAYITQWNYKRTISKLELPSIIGDPYKRNLWFLRNKEKWELVAFREFLKEPSGLVEMYKKIELSRDTFTYTTEAIKPAYHSTNQCENLLSKYENFEVPAQIRDKGLEEVQKFRAWFKDTRKYLANNKLYFQNKLSSVWGVKRDMTRIEAKNSGNFEFLELTPHQIESKIDKLLSQSGEFVQRDAKTLAVCRKYMYRSFLSERIEPLPDPLDGVSDVEAKNILIEFDLIFRKPIKLLVQEYYRITLNPDLSFDSAVLDQLNFVPCLRCYNKKEDE